MDVVVAEHLAKRYGVGKRKRPQASLGLHVLRRREPVGKEIWALRDVSFSLPEGEALGVVGPNGAGKSTLLKLLARVTPPSQGRARVRGRVVSLLELGAGFQPELTGRDNVQLNAAFHGIDRREVARRMDAIVEFADLQEAIDRPVTHYSSGMYLRLAFSVAINLEPDILLADEVLAVGDLEFQERCLRRVQEAGREDGLTVLFVSHDMAAIRRLCARTLWIDQGRVSQDGPTADVVSAYERSAWARFSHSAAGDHGRHASEYGEILGGRLLSADGVTIGAVRVSDDVAVELTFRTRVPDIAVRGGVVVQSEGLVAFRSVMPRLEHIAEPGVYTARVHIPGHLLNDTTYNVKLGLHVHQDGERMASMGHDDALSFKVWDANEGDSARGDYDATLDGLVRPRLEWVVEPARVTARD